MADVSTVECQKGISAYIFYNYADSSVWHYTVDTFVYDHSVKRKLIINRRSTRLNFITECPIDTTGSVRETLFPYFVSILIIFSYVYISLSLTVQ